MDKRPARFSPRIRSPGPTGAPAPFSTDEHGEGYRPWRPDRDRRGYRQPLPDRFTLDKPGTCEVICQRMGREYKYREYCC